MQIAQSISFKRAGKNARKIVANFTGTAVEVADIIAVDGTEDFRRINKSNNQWNSRCKYSSLELSLLYLDLTPQGLKVERANYDKTGKLITTVTEDAVVIDLAANVNVDSLEVTLTWTSTVEQAVRQYTCYRENPNDGAFENFAGSTPKGAGSSYLSIDSDDKERGNYNYYIYAQLQSTDPLKELGKLVGFIEDVVI